MARRRQIITSREAELLELALLDLEGRPFLHEQGNAVTRGFVEALELDDTHWTLHLRDVQYLNKDGGAWEPPEPSDEYGGMIERTSCTRYWRGKAQKEEMGFELSCYGVYVQIGCVRDDPWGENIWWQLDTEAYIPDLYFED